MATKRKPAARSGKGKKASSSLWNALAYGAAAVVLLGLLWVAWPLLFPEKPQPDTVHAVRELSVEHPDAEALNPPGEDTKKK